METAAARPPRGGGRMRPGRLPTRAGRVGGYLLGPGLSALSPLLVLPTIASATSDAGWATIAIGQSIGMFAMVVVVYGWTINGPVKAARATPSQLPVLYHDSLVARGTLLVPAAAAAAVAAWLSAPPGWGEFAAVVSLSFTVGGLSSAWLCIGLGRPMWIVYSETLPRLGFSLLAAFLIGQGGSLWWYPVLLGLGTVLGVAGFSLLAVRPARPRTGDRTRLATLLFQQSPSAVTTIVGATYAVGAIFLASTVTSTSEIAQLSSADRIYRLATVGITVAASLLTPWIAVQDETTGRRTRSALLMMSAIGVVGLPAITFLAPLAARLLFGPDLEPSRATCLAYGLAFLGVALSTTLGQHYLVPRGREVDYMTGSVLAALVGAPSILLLAARFGATGAATGLAVSEMAIVAVLVLRSLRLRSGGGRPQEHPSRRRAGG